MTETPIACSLSADGMQQRLAAVARLGAERLIDSEAQGRRHLLRFHADAATRRRLEGIVAAEARCCPFLELSLDDRDGELVLSIAAPEDRQPLADELAAAFSGERR